MGTELTVESFHKNAAMAQQSQLALAQSVVGAFDTAIKSHVQKADIWNSMVGAAANFKQSQVDEWYKTQRLELESRELGIRESALKQELDLRTEDQNLRKAEAEERRRLQAERENYGRLSINIKKADSFYEDQDKQHTQTYEQQDLLIKSLENEKLGRRPSINADGLVTGWKQVAPIANPARRAELDAEIEKARAIRDQALKDRDGVRSKRITLNNLYSDIGMASPDDIQGRFQEIQTGVPFKKESASVNDEASFFDEDITFGSPSSLLPGPNGEPPGGIRPPNNITKPNAVIKPPPLAPPAEAPPPVSDKYSQDDFYNQVSMKDSDPAFVREIYKGMAPNDQEQVKRESHIPREEQMWDLVINQKISKEPFADKHYERLHDEYERFGGNPGRLLQVEAMASKAISDIQKSPDYIEKSKDLENFVEQNYIKTEADKLKNSLFDPNNTRSSGMPMPGNARPSSSIKGIIDQNMVNPDGSAAIRANENPNRDNLEDDRGTQSRALRQYEVMFGSRELTAEDGGLISEKLYSFINDNYSPQELGIDTGGIHRKARPFFPMLGDSDVRMDDLEVKRLKKLAIGRKINELSSSSNIKEAVIKLLSEKI